MSAPLSRLPRLEITLEGEPVESRTAAALLEMRLQQKLSLPDQCELTFANEAGGALTSSQETLGQALRISIDGELLFEGETTALRHEYLPDRGDLVKLRAHSLLHRLQKRQHVRIFEDVDLDTLARAVLADLPYSVELDDVSTDWSYVAQCGKTDLNFLDQRARQCGLFFVARNGVLKFTSLAGDGEPHSLTLGRNLHRVSVELNARTACRQVAAKGWNPSTGAACRGQAETPRISRGSGMEIPDTMIHGDGARRFLGPVFSSDDAATAMAQAILDEHAHQEVSLWGAADGSVSIMPGRLVRIEGVAENLEGDYVVTEALHTINSDEGYSCEFSNSLPNAPAAPTGFMAIGEVASLDDPQSIGRIRVTFPALEDLTSDWLQVVAPGAGSAKGLVMLPNVGDLVLVLCPAEIGQGMVVGGLFGANGPKDAGITSGQRSRFRFGTANGQALEFDEAAGSATFRDGNGNILEFTPNGVRLHASADLDITAPGRRIRFSAKAIDFNQA